MGGGDNEGDDIEDEEVAVTAERDLVSVKASELVGERILSSSARVIVVAAWRAAQSDAKPACFLGNAAVNP